MNSKVKPQLMLHPNGSLSRSWWLSILREHFTVIYYYPGIEIDPKTTVCMVDIQVNYQHDTSTGMLDAVTKAEAPLVFECLWERKDFYNDLDAGRGYKLYNENWFWYNESLWYKDLSYDQYIPAKTYALKALMPMHVGRIHRNNLLDALEPFLNDFLWSYVKFGKRLTGDNVEGAVDQRLFKSEWYDTTCFSLVSETYVDSVQEQEIFITEKSFKPMAFKHPFMIFGNQGILRKLKNLGFETFENLFDESYDNLDVESRLQVIVENVKTFEKKAYDQLTCEKLAHNYHRFFDHILVKQKVVDEIINPILEYAKI